MSPATPSEDRTVHEYPADGIVVTWEPGRCRHAAECVGGLPAVFDTERRPWIDAAGAPVEDVVTVIDRCPSFALGYRVDGGPTRTAPD